MQVKDLGKGLRTVEILLRQGGEDKVLVEESFPRTWFPWEDSEATRSYEFVIEKWLEQKQVLEGPLQLVVRARDQSNLLFLSRSSEKIFAFELDTRPPQVSPLSRQHYITQGGSEAILYRVFEEGISSGVRVADHDFVGYPVAPEGTHIALFALNYDQGTDTPIVLWAEDAAGNRTEIGFWHRIKEVDFRQRRINITDAFISRTAPEILSRSDQLFGEDTLLESFLAINRDLRKINNARIAEISNSSSPELLWHEPFLQLTNSQVESVFADHRSYYYEGEKVDEQVHLGFDLASLAQSPVEASNAGRVVLADYLGIYGNTLIIDHGWGLFSLYGHLSSIEVAEGQMVTRGQSLGLTGQTGLAGGDHLHFSMLLQGVQVNPIEWWDPKWVQDHLLAKLPE